MSTDDFTATQSQEQRLDALVRSAGEELPQLEGYQLDELKGRGTFGEVWSARQLSSGQKVAVKLFRARPGASWTYFRAEVERHSLVAEHPNIVTLLDANLESDPPYFVMNLYPGSLAEHSKSPVKAVVRWLEQIARALRHTHQRGLLHCDLKPSNVLLDVEEQAQLADFGQAVLRSQETRSLGSLGFMAPEQTEAGAVPDVRWDVYALGATAYYLLSGQRPRLSDERIRSTTPQGLLADYRANLSAQALVPLPIDADLWQIVESCLQLDPARRPAGMGEVLQDLERRRKRRPLLCRQPWTPGYLAARFVRRHALSVTFASILLGLLLAGLALFYNQLQTTRARLADELFNRGWDLLSKGETAQAYLWWAEAVDYAPDRPEFRRATRAYPFPLQRMWKHEGEVHHLAFSPDGKHVLAAALDGGSSLWSVADGTRIAKISGPTAAQPGKQFFDEERVLHLCDFASDGRHFATARPVRIWDQGGRLVKECGPGDQVVWSPDGRQLMAQTDQGIQLYSASGVPLRRIAHKGVLGMRFSPDGQQILSWGAGPVCLWNVADGKLLRELMATGFYADFDAQGRRVLVGRLDDALHIFSVDGTKIRSLKVPSPVTMAAFSKDGTRVVVGSLLGELGVYSIEHGDLVVPLKRSRWTPLGVRFCRGDSQILTYSFYSLARLWDARTGEPCSPSLLNDGPLASASLSPDERSLATASGDGTVRVFQIGGAEDPLREIALQGGGSEWDMGLFAPEGRALLHWQTKSGQLQVLAPATGRPILPPIETGEVQSNNRGTFSADGRYLAVAGRTPRVVEVATGNPIGPALPPSADGYFSAAVTSDGKWMATLEWNRRVTLWNVNTGQREGLPQVVSRVPVSCAFTPDGRELLVGTMDSAVRRTEVPGGQLKEFVRQGMFVCCLVLSRDGRLLFVGCGDGTARVWRLKDGQPVSQSMAHEGAVVDVAFSPTGDRLATVCLGGRVRLWTHNGEPVTPPLGHHKAHAVVFSAAGDRLITASNDGIRFWDARLDLAESPQQLKNRVQAETGMQLKGQQKNLQPLTEVEWRALPQTNRPPGFPTDPGLP
ncbi:protein kinase [bacterium]|nr:protein kinase [bacterium]